MNETDRLIAAGKAKIASLAHKRYQAYIIASLRAGARNESGFEVIKSIILAGSPTTAVDYHEFRKAAARSDIPELNILQHVPKDCERKYRSVSDITPFVYYLGKSLVTGWHVTKFPCIGNGELLNHLNHAAGFDDGFLAT